MYRTITDLAIARDVTAAWGMDDPSIYLIAVSENSTYKVIGCGGCTGILRVARTGYHTPGGLETELAWLERLAANPQIPIARPIRTVDGGLIARTECTGEERLAVMFESVPGVTKDDAAASAADFHGLGRFAALLHDDVRRHGVPGTGERIAWDWDHLHGAYPRWGRWEDGPGVTPAVADVLSRAESVAHGLLDDYGTGPGEYGFIHSDLRQSNVMYGPDGVTLIDFDDCGYGWYLYDFAGAVSFLETSPHLGEWMDAWVEGYRSVAPLDERGVAMLPTFVMVRRLMLLAWLGSHPHAAEAAALGRTFAADTAALAEAYLATHAATAAA